MNLLENYENLNANIQRTEISRLVEKRERNMFKKLYYLNTQRVLKIIGYHPSISDEKKFLFSNYKICLLYTSDAADE